MPRRTLSIPKYRHHKASRQAVVTLNGRDFYLGPYDTKTSRNEYDRLVGEWQANGRQLRSEYAPHGISMVEVLNGYRKFANEYYVKNGKPTGSIYGVRAVLKLLRKHCGKIQAEDFGPLALKNLQQKMIKDNRSRRYINDHTDRIKRIFRWAVSEELISPSSYQALSSVSSIRKGRTAARETSPVMPIANEVIDSTLPHLPGVVADMVQFQRLTGCRPGEVCIVRPCDVDTTSDVWLYQPQSHKTEHLGRKREIHIGPRAQLVLRPYLRRNTTAYCFSPAESEKQRTRLRSESRMTPIEQGNQPGTNKTRKPKKTPGDLYSVSSYRRAINRACNFAFPAPHFKNEREKNTWQQKYRWTPNQLRHTTATEIRKQYGIESAQTVLGHASLDVTQIYAERDNQKAAQIMLEIG